MVRIIFVCLVTMFVHSALADTGKIYQLNRTWVVEDDGSQPFLFGILEDVLIDDSGLVFVLDSQLSEIKAFSSQGEFVGNFGARGEGPGEFMAGGFLVKMPDGNVGVVSKLLAEITMFDPNTGIPQGARSFDGLDGGPALFNRAQSYSCESSTKNLVSVVIEMSGAGNRWSGKGGGFWNGRIYLAAFDPRTDSTRHPVVVFDEVGEMSGSDVEEEDYYLLWRPWTIDSFDRVVMAPYWGEYHLRYYDEYARLVQEVSFPFKHRKRTKDEINRRVNFLWGGVEPEQIGIKSIPSQHEAVVREIFPRPDGTIWVRTNKSAKCHSSGVLFEFDSISPKGEMGDKVTILGEGDGDLDRYFFGPRNKVVCIKNGEGFIRTARGKFPTDQSYELILEAYDLVEVQ